MLSGDAIELVPRTQPGLRAVLFVVGVGLMGALGEAAYLSAGTDTFPPAAMISAGAIHECSGLVSSRQQPGIFWTHNDSGGRPEIYAITAAGGLVATITIEEGMNRDWEDIAADDEGFLYVGDLGDNLGKRPLHMVYKIREPEVLAGEKGSVPILERMLFRFPDEKYDCESLFALRGELYVITKQIFQAPTLFRLVPMEREDLDNDGMRWRPYDKAMCAVPVCRLGVRVATGADVDAAGRRLAVSSYGQTWVYDLPADGDLSVLGKSRPRRVSYPGMHQVEAVTFDGDDVLIASEQRRIWRLTPADFAEARRWWKP